MRANHTDITIVLDQSGSMESCRKDTIGGFNTFVDGQKGGVGTADITLVRFNHLYTAGPTQPAQDATHLTVDTYRPDGFTALLDAVGKAIVEAGTRLTANPAEKVVFVIITDGEENASKEYKLDQIKKMIETQQKDWNWQFVFLGANQDAFANAGAMGINRSNVANYDSAKTDGAMRMMCSKTTAYKDGFAADMSFSDDERNQIK